jgi:hypothetical protein
MRRQLRLFTPISVKSEDGVLDQWNLISPPPQTYIAQMRFTAALTAASPPAEQDCPANSPSHLTGNRDSILRDATVAVLDQVSDRLQSMVEEEARDDDAFEACIAPPCTPSVRLHGIMSPKNLFTADVLKALSSIAMGRT